MQKSVLCDILKKIKPSKEEIRKVNSLAKGITNTIKVRDAQIMLGGSIAKDTWLHGMHDIDIFVAFNYNKYKNKSSQLADILEKHIRHLPIKRLHGSRDYFQINKGNISIEIIPILRIKRVEQAKNITDISPLHASWVKKYKIQDEIRLTKAFAIAQHTYGAESYLKGFSGYVLEILTIHYGSFLGFIKATSKWKKQIIIDTEKLLKNPLKELNKSKIQSPLIVVDPVDKTRNASAVLSQQNYNLMIKAARSFLNNPSEKYFIVRKKTIPKNAFFIEIKLKKKDDHIAGKLDSLFIKLNHQIIQEGFSIKKSGFIFDKKSILWFIFKSNILSSYCEVRGPPIKLKDHVIKFRKKHKKTFMKNSTIYAVEKRKFTRVIILINYFSKIFKKELSHIGKITKIHEPKRL